MEWPYVPYWEAVESSSAYGFYEDNEVLLEVGGAFDYLTVFLAGEFVCSFELFSAKLNELIQNNECLVSIKSPTLIKDQNIV